MIDSQEMKLIGTIAMPATTRVAGGRPGERRSTRTSPTAAALPSSIPSRCESSKSSGRRNSKTITRSSFRQGADQVIVGGQNGVLSAYTPGGEHVGSARAAAHRRVQYGLRGNLVVCAGRGVETVIAVSKGSARRVVGRLDTGHGEAHAVGIDEATNDMWIVGGDSKGDWVQRLSWTS